MSRHRFWIAFALLLSPVFPAHAWADTPVPSSVSSAMRHEDPRLEKRVTLRAPRILVGELLERWSRQSGVPLAADAWTGAGDDAVTVSLQDVPLADAMDALWGLFSYKKADWDWRRQGSPGHYSYTLARPGSARFLADDLKKQVQLDFEAQAQKMLDALSESPDALAKDAKNDPLLESLTEDPRVRPGLEMLKSLPAEMQISLLRNHQTVTVPISDLSPEAQAFVRSQWQFQVDHGAQALKPDGTWGPTPAPTQVSFSAQQQLGNIAPTLSIDAGEGSGGYVGGNWMQKDWEKKMEAIWMRPGDAPDDAASARLMAAPSPASGVSTPPSSLNSLVTAAQASHLPLIARLPHESASLPLPYGKSVQFFLTQAHDQLSHVDHKWRDGVLLLTYSSWFMDESEDSRVPWTEVAHLRDAEAGGDGFLSLKDLARAGYLLNETQLHRLAEWFPVMGTVGDWRDFFAHFDQSPEFRSYVMSPQGTNQLDYAPALFGIGLLKQTYPDAHLRLTERENLQHTPPSHEFSLQVLSKDGKTVEGQGSEYTAHEYQAALHIDEGLAGRTPTR